MAVRHGYGKIAGTDALVFAYDTGDTVNSYKGRPTTNYGPADFANWGTEGDANDIAQRIATGNYYKGQPTYNCRAHSTQSYRGIDKTISGLRTAAGSSGTVTMSCMVRNNNPSSYSMYAYIGHDFGSTRTIAANSDWQKVQWTVNQSSMNNDYVEFRPYTANTSIYLEMTMPMVEVNVGNASQFVNGTRSATEGLLDLTGNSSIDLTNVSFDSNAQMTFDGTDDKAVVANFPHIWDGSVTMEAVVAWNDDSRSIIFGNYNVGANDINFEKLTGRALRFYWNRGERDVTTASNVVTTTGNPHHVVMIRDKGSNSFKFYVDGAVIATSSNVGTDVSSTGSTFRIGGDTRDGTTIHNGDIPMLKIYSRALTADEVASNYNHYKSRFGI